MSYHPNAYAFTLTHTDYTDFFMAIDDGRQGRYPLHGHPLNNILDLTFGHAFLERTLLYKYDKKLWEPLAHLSTHLIISAESYGAIRYDRERLVTWAEWLSSHYQDMTLLEVGQFARLMASEILNTQYLHSIQHPDIEHILQERMERFTETWQDPQLRTTMLDLHERNGLLPWLLEGGELIPLTVNNGLVI